MTSTTPPLGKYLASTDKKTRDKAIKNLATFLSEGQHVLPKPDLDKLWKGIFYCFWMSDKPLVQQALASELAELLITITSKKASFAFLQGFWECTVREWNGIDHLRIDKYYMLIRRFLNATFRLLLATEWDANACEDYNRILIKEGGPLCPNDMRVPTSLTYHITDIYLEELDKVIGTTPNSLPTPLVVLIGPFFTLAAQTTNSATFKRIQSAIIEPLMASLKQPTLSGDEDVLPKSKRRRLNEEPLYLHLVGNLCFENPAEGKVDGSKLKQKLLRRIFDVASQPDTTVSSRRKMYVLWKDNYDEPEEQ